ncbi:MAG TPA: DUF6701 domain-containing protein [Verrucomicrobiae bacterium]|nr:DUF6701 domain-containing protein [Verrucomicrobiae bacterium]
MTPLRHAVLLLALATVAPAQADIVLQGSQHVGDCNDFAAGGAACSGFTPLDPQGRASMYNTLIKFHLSTTTTITGVRLNGPIFPDRTQLEVYIQSLGGTRTIRSGIFLVDTFTLSPSLVLTPGSYSLWLDGGCSSPSGLDYFPSACGNSNDENDFGFSSITLLSAQTSTSRMFNRRRHIGDNAASVDGDNDYDQSPGDRFYPDGAEAASVSETFTVDTDQRLIDLSFYSARDITTGIAAARVYVDGLLLGSLDRGSSATAPYSLGTNLLLQDSVVHTLTIDSIDTAGNRDDSSWDDIVLTFADTVTSGTPGLFNAVDTGANGLSGTLGTKAAGAAPGVDIVALNALSTGIDIAYTGTVVVELMDATTDGTVNAFTGCHSTWTAVTGMSTAVTFIAGNAGRVALPGPFFAYALRKAALRMTDSSTGAVACSSDRFALRPDHFVVTASHGTPTTPGVTPLTNTGTSGDPQHRAGQPFTIQATAVDLSGNALSTYTGTLENSHDTTALAPATVNGSLNTPSWSAAGAVRSTAEARYNEAGAFTLQLRDKTWSDTDAGQSTDAQRWIVGTADVGRFTPDHFAFAELAAEFDPACSDSFTYLGQSFGYAVAPTATVTAMTGDAAPTVTRNYTAGALFKLPASIGASSVAAEVGTVVAVNVPSPENTVANLGNGIAQITLAAGSTFAFTRPAAPLVPFDADIAITLGALGEADGIDFSPAAPSFGVADPGLGVDFSGNNQSMRFGRLVIDNAQGSELRSLAVPLRVEYWNTGFQPSLADNCTDDMLATGNIDLSGPLGASTTPTLVSNANGRFTLNLTAPGTAGVVNVEALISGTHPWLRTDRDADGDYDDNPRALVTFGLANDDQNRRIYSREVTGY